MADESEKPLDSGCGELDELLIFGNPETRRQFIRQVAGTALSIVAEIQRVFAKGSGESLRERKISIHSTLECADMPAF
jgi:hypothetical protein